MTVKSTVIYNIIRIAGVVILAIFLIYLPLDNGGFYPRSKALLAIAALFLFAIMVIFNTGEKYPRPLVASAGLLFFFLLLSTLFSTDIHNSMQDFVYYTVLLAGFTAAYHLIQNKSLFRPFVYILLISLSLTSLFAVGYFFLKVGTEARAIGRFFQADVLGGYLIILIPLALMLYLVSKKPLTAIIFMLICGLSSASLFLTFSRGALLAFGLTIPFVVWHSRKYNSFWNIAAKLTGVVLLTVFIVLLVSFQSRGLEAVTGQVMERVQDTGELMTGEGSAGARLNFYTAALKITAERPLFGVGLGNYGFHYPRFQQNVIFFSSYPHSFYLALLSQGGIPAFLSFLLLLWFLVKKIKSSILSLDAADAFTKPAAFSLAAGLAASLIHIMMDVDFIFAGVSFTFWVIAGVLAGLGCEAMEESGADEMYPAKVSVRIVRLLFAVIITAMIFVPFLFYLSHSLIQRGDALLKIGRLQEAERHYREAAVLDPLNNEAFRKAANFLHNENRNEEALLFIERAVTLSPYRARLYELRGRIRQQLDMKDLSALDYKKSIELDPINQVYAYQALAEYYREKGDTASALQMLERSLANYSGLDFNRLWAFRAGPLKPQIAAVFLLQGNIHMEDHQYETAVESFKKSLSFEENIPSYFGLGLSYFQLNRWQDSLDAFLKVNEVQNDISIVHYYLHRCYQVLGNEDLSQKHQKEYERLSKVQTE